MVLGSQDVALLHRTIWSREQIEDILDNPLILCSPLFCAFCAFYKGIRSKVELLAGASIYLFMDSFHFSHILLYFNNSHGYNFFQDIHEDFMA